jgi:hypothetical protein
MFLINFAHPLSTEHLAHVEQLADQPISRLIAVPTQFDHSQQFSRQVVALVDSVGLSPTEWQTTPLLIVPPTLNYIAAIVLAELHGRMGYWPTLVRLRPVSGSTPPRFEVAEIINLQAIRDAARQRR